jgi:hypothetical protein
MRVGRDDNFLSIERIQPGDPHSPWRIEAVATSKAQRFSAVHERVILENSLTTAQQFAVFEALKTQKVEIPLTEGGWLRLERDARGYITVCYRISCWNLGAVLKGKVTVEGEFAGSFCREFAVLLREGK